MKQLDPLMTTTRPFLTDGGFETWMLFKEGFDLPEFAAIVLLDDPKARQAMRQYFDRFLSAAATAETGFVLDTNTWRGGAHWAEKLGRTVDDLMRLNAASVAFAQEIRDAWSTRVSPILINGVVGPAGDGYAPDRTPNADEAQAIHQPQVTALAAAGVDMISGATITNAPEAIGLARAAAAAGLPSVISFTVETDGCLPTGQTLPEAIAETDAETGDAPAYYMINCAHPDHFTEALASKANWIKRIGGLRANASRLSHAELDAAETLDDGDPTEFGALHGALAKRLPHLRVYGGCCGTDHRHVDCVSRHIHGRAS
ncbi:MAG: homocysteine S-methyltransferase family protein [Rhodobacteraceae bacterium]|nr:homocysteine S-methyltransferase family protein [Paracoccaceae bacterium]